MYLACLRVCCTSGGLRPLVQAGCHPQTCGLSILKIRLPKKAVVDLSEIADMHG
jgi:hypothetical protein